MACSIPAAGASAAAALGSGTGGTSAMVGKSCANLPSKLESEPKMLKSWNPNFSPDPSSVAHRSSFGGVSGGSSVHPFLYFNWKPPNFYDPHRRLIAKILNPPHRWLIASFLGGASLGSSVHPFIMYSFEAYVKRRLIGGSSVISAVWLIDPSSNLFFKVLCKRVLTHMFVHM